MYIKLTIELYANTACNSLRHQTFSVCVSFICRLVTTYNVLDPLDSVSRRYRTANFSQLTQRCYAMTQNNGGFFFSQTSTQGHCLIQASGSDCSVRMQTLGSSRLGATGSKVKFMLRPTFGRPVSLLVSDIQLAVELPFWQEEESATYSCVWASTAQSFSGPSPTRFTIIFDCFKFEAPSVRFSRYSVSRTQQKNFVPLLLLAMYYYAFHYRNTVLLSPDRVITQPPAVLLLLRDVSAVIDTTCLSSAP